MDIAIISECLDNVHCLGGIYPFDIDRISKFGTWSHPLLASEQRRHYYSDATNITRTTVLVPYFHFSIIQYCRVLPPFLDRRGAFFFYFLHSPLLGRVQGHESLQDIFFVVGAKCSGTVQLEHELIIFPPPSTLGLPSSIDQSQSFHIKYPKGPKNHGCFQALFPSRQVDLSNTQTQSNPN